MVQSVTDKIEKGLGKTVQLPVLGRVTLPHSDTLVYYVGIGVLVALEVVEWPIALIIGTGHMMATRQHRSLIRGLGEALEQA
jgi:hypothetical protein